MISNTPKKEKFLDRLAEDSGVAIVVVNKDSKEISASNNNSMCRSLSASAEFAPRCAEYCGKAFASATEAGKAVQYECYAGLTCKAVPVWDGGSQFVAIIGRTFLKAENYRAATERAITGEWRQFRPTEFFENVLISGSDESLDRTCARLEKFSYRERNDILEIEQLRLEEPKVKESKQPAAKEAGQPDPKEITNLINKFKTETEKAAVELHAATSVDVQKDPKAAGEWRSLFGSLMKLEYRDACKKILSYLKDRYALGSLVWLERRDDNLEVLVALGSLADKAVKIGIAADNKRLADAARREMPLEFRERKKVDGVDPGSSCELESHKQSVPIGARTRPCGCRCQQQRTALQKQQTRGSSITVEERRAAARAPTDRNGGPPYGYRCFSGPAGPGWQTPSGAVAHVRQPNTRC